MHRLTTYAGWTASFVLAGLAAGLAAGLMAVAPARAGTAPGAAPEPQAMPIRADGSSIFADVAARVRPAVVFIRTEESDTPDDSSRGDSPFDFFRDFFPDTDGHPHLRRNGGGSGFILDDKGRILTNYHVIKGADRITVVMEDKDVEQEYEARVVGFDRFTDIAIIQIDPPANVRTVPLGDSDKIRVGDWVMAIGTPFGQLQGSVTVGVVSAKGRNDLTIVGGEATYQNYIQTDASINFGNSGGPLVNVHGEAIGINTAINPSGQGIGFAIPINMAKNIMRQLIERGKVQYGFIGIQLRELDKTMAEGLGMSIDHGILVEDVLPNTPAQKAGLRRRDVIVEYNGQDVRDDNRFRLMVGNTPVGTEVPIVIVRDGKRHNMNVTISERPEDEALASAEPTPNKKQKAWLGLQVEDATDREVRRRYDMAGNQTGVVVVDVEEGSPASEAGLREGDVITEVYSHEVRNLKEYGEIAKKLEDRKDPIAFLVKRGRSTTFVTVMPERR